MKLLDAKQLDALLDETALQPSDGFTDRIMHRVHLAADNPLETSPSQPISWTQWFALLLTGAAGITQIVAYILSAWLTTSAG